MCWSELNRLSDRTHCDLLNLMVIKAQTLGFKHWFKTTQAAATQHQGKNKLPFTRSRFTLAVIASDGGFTTMLSSLPARKVPLVQFSMTLLKDGLLKRDVPLPLHTGLCGPAVPKDGLVGRTGRRG